MKHDQLSSICKYIDSMENIEDSEFLYDLKNYLHNVSCIMVELRKNGKIFDGKIFEGTTDSFGNICVEAKQYINTNKTHECRKYTSINGKYLNCGNQV